MRLTMLLLLLSNLVYSQYPHDNKRDHIWMFGYENSPPNFGGTCLNFNQNPPSISYVSQQIHIDAANASISDTSGNLLFYTNAMYVADANHQIMPHGDSLNYGDLYNYFGAYGYIMPQGALILPSPGLQSIYYIFHEKLVFSQPIFDLPIGFYYSLVDMNQNGGLGDVTQKNVLLIDDTLDYGCITATRHANGRDWWILIPEYNNNRYYRLLLSSLGVTLDTMQQIGTASYFPEVAQACFSPDGTKYVRWGGAFLNHPCRLEVFDFDRCTGILSNYHNLWYTDSCQIFGVAISVNSQFMYVSAQTRIDQYNLNATDIGASKQTVAIYDGFVDPLFPLGVTMFSLAQLAPDNKIYICAPGGTQYLHVISQPDNEGLSCNVLQHAVHLSTFNASSIPNFPNFRLGPVDGSICDSLGIDIVTNTPQIFKPEISFVVWPNPANDFINYKVEEPALSGNFKFVLIDNTGRKIKGWEVNSSQSIGNFDVSGIQQGSYLLLLYSEKGELLGKQKLLILR